MFEFTCRRCCDLLSSVIMAPKRPKPRNARSRSRLRSPPSLSEADHAAKCGISLMTYSRLQMMRVPVLLFELLVAMVALSGPPTNPIDLVEYVCGVAAITQHVRLAGCCAIGYDVDKDNSNNDLCMLHGFLCALRHLQTLSITGLAWFATVCSSWVWMSRSTTGRGDDPMGFTAYTNVGERKVETSLPTLSTWQGNVQVARSALLMCLTSAMGETWILEQPKSSVMIQHKCMDHLYKLGDKLPWAQWHRAETWMGSFATKTLKPKYFISNKRWVKSLSRAKSLRAPPRTGLSLRRSVRMAPLRSLEMII